MKCIICESDIDSEFGNNPSPVALEGSCCNACNELYVIPARVIWWLSNAPAVLAEYNEYDRQMRATGVFVKVEGDE